METAFYLFLLFLGLTLATARKPVLLGITLGLLVLTRYDGALFALALLPLLWRF